MKANVRWMVALGVISGACLSGSVAKAAEGETTVVGGSYEAQQKAAAAAREKDPAWKAACTEVGLIKVGEGGKSGALKNFCLDAEGNILACYAPEGAKSSGKNAAGIRVYSPKGELLRTMPLEIKPTAIEIGRASCRERV